MARPRSIKAGGRRPRAKASGRVDNDADGIRTQSVPGKSNWPVLVAGVVVVVVFVALAALSGTSRNADGAGDGPPKPYSSAPRNLEGVADMPAGRRHERFMHPDVDATPSPPPSLRWKVLHSYPHDSRAFTQGLEYHHGYLWEGTGLYHRSQLRQVEFETGSVVKALDIPGTYFGEGITVVNDTVIQLTWKKGKALTYTFPGLKKTGEFSFSTTTGEGWGICYDGHELAVSDGSSNIMFWDPETYQETRRVVVRRDGHAIPRINELECVRGEILANVWFSDTVLRIRPSDGKVMGSLDFKSLYPKAGRSPDAVLNGIAYDEAGSTESEVRLFITGKLWDAMFEVLWYP